jgi:hypothetical protein
MRQNWRESWPQDSNKLYLIFHRAKSKQSELGVGL